jgi:diphthamide synthase subunit DPH2
MLTPFEVEVMLGQTPIEPYRVDEAFSGDLG